MFLSNHKLSKMNQPKKIALIALASIASCSILLAGCPIYQVFYAGMHGRAELNRATYNRQVVVQEAEAKEQAAIHLYSADTIRAHGVARANQIIGQSLNNNEAYLRWLWVDALEHQQNVIYVATEAGLPITEAGRLGQFQSKKDTLVASKKHSD